MPSVYKIFMQFTVQFNQHKVDNNQLIAQYHVPYPSKQFQEP